MKHIATSSLPVMIFAGTVLLVYILYVRLWLTWLIQRIRKKKTCKILTNRIAIYLHIVAGVGFVCMAYAYFIEPYWPQVNVISIQTEKLTSATFRIVHISDTHCDAKVRLEKHLPGIISSLKPDIIVFTGDTINDKEALPLFQDTMRKLRAPLGKFAVNGNWDCWYRSTLDLFDNTGFEELRTDEKTVEKDGECISISGLAFENGKNFQDVAEKLQPENFNLLLYHNSDLMDHTDNSPVDLYLCGHTHGGQVALPFYGALTTLSKHGKKYEAGLYQQEHIRLYVNRGIGMEGGKAPRVRFWARPEIAVFDITPKQSESTHLSTQTPVDAKR
ncbi:MAG: metallophosphoesterase [Planctomycetota bacterium]